MCQTVMGSCHTFSALALKSTQPLAKSFLMQLFHTVTENWEQLEDL